VSEVERLIVDTDPGIDDAAALLFALASPEVQIDLITTVFGNVSVEQATTNALRLLALASPDGIPVHRGASKPLRGTAKFAAHIHGSDGLGDIEWPQRRTELADGHATGAIIRHVTRHPGEITVMALGPLTNIALALSEEPALAKQIKRVICMGGAVLIMGNASPVASANFVSDPWAAAIVYDSGVPIVQIGLDVCQKVYFTEEQLGALARDGGPPARRLVEMSRFIKAAYARTPAAVSRWTLYGAGPWVHFNDVPAMGYAILPEVFTGEFLPVVIETEGVCRGQTVADFRGQLGRDPNATVPLDVDGARLSRLFVERVARLGLR
jgi:inosine-uridine nucleoside N-ribohydrolase